MIVKVLPTRPAGTGRPLGTYILAAKHKHKGERLGPYIFDPAKDKVEWARTVNAGVDDPLKAIGAIECYNAQNLRKHRVSRWEHVVISFPKDKHITRQQAEAIEDRLMAAIDFGDHPRISVAHHDAEHFHIHVAVSRISPEPPHKALHPRHNHFRLQAEAARLELDLGLSRERKTMLARERKEIQTRVAIDGTIMIVPTSENKLMDTIDQQVTITFTRPELHQLIANHTLAERRGGVSITPGVTQSISDKLTTAAGAPGTTILQREVSINLTRSELFKVILDHQVFNQDFPSRRPDLQASIGAKLDRAETQILSQERTNTATRGPQLELDLQKTKDENMQHRATPRDALYARYESEKAIALGERKAAEQAIYDRFSAHHQQLTSFYNVQHEKQKLEVQHWTERRLEHQVISAANRGDRVQATQLRSQQLAAARRDHPLPTWDAFLKREADRGDREAGRILQEKNRERGRDNVLDR